MAPLRLFLPNKAGWFFFLVLALFLFGRPMGLLADGGTCRYILSGMYFFHHHICPTKNFFTAIDPNLPWMTTSFLSDIAYAAFYKLFGLNGVVLLAAAAIALALTISYQLSRMRGLGMLPGLVMLCLATSVSSLHWLARPHVFTYCFFLIGYYLVFISHATNKRRLALLCILACIWANTHGSFYLLAGMIGAKLLADALNFRESDGDLAFRAHDGWQWNVITLLAVLAASAINTRGGPAFLSYIFQYMHSNAVLANSEWRNIDFSLGAPVWSFLALMACAVTVAVYSPRRPKLDEFAFLLFLFAFSLYAMRVMPYFALAILPAIAPQWKALSEKVAASTSCNIFQSGIKRLATFDIRVGSHEPDSPKVVAASIAVSAILAGAFVVLPNLRITDFDPSDLPVACVNYVNEHHISGVPFTQDNWAPYLFWKTGHGVFVDDSTDLYPPEIIRDYASIYFSYPDWRSVLAKHHFGYIVVPRGLPLAKLLLADSNWNHCCDDAASMLFVPNAPRQATNQ